MNTKMRRLCLERGHIAGDLFVSEFVRAGGCVILMLALAISGTELLVSIGLPIAMYAGLRLFTGAGSSNVWTGRANRPRSDREIYDRCCHFNTQIAELALDFSEELQLGVLARIKTHAGNCLRVIAEDGTYQTSATLYELMETTVTLGERYRKVARRGLAIAEVDWAVADDLLLLDSGYQRFWEYLNRDAVDELQALSTTIELSLGEYSSAIGSEAFS